MSAQVRLGCSGWAYASWRPGFYPAKTPIRKLLEAYAARLNAVEVNYTFRSLPTEKICANWLAQTPASFRFAMKAPQSITHQRKLRDCAGPLEAFAQSLALLSSGGRLGPVLFQLPPTFKADPALLDEFLAVPFPFRTAWEFRHPSWFTDAVYKVLAARGAVLCAAESDTLRSPDLPLVPDLRVFRLRRSTYSHDDLQSFAAHFTSLAEGGADVYAFFMHEDASDGPLRAAAVLAQIPPELRG